MYIATSPQFITCCRFSYYLFKEIVISFYVVFFEISKLIIKKPFSYINYGIFICTLLNE